MGLAHVHVRMHARAHTHTHARAHTNTHTLILSLSHTHMHEDNIKGAEGRIEVGTKHNQNKKNNLTANRLMKHTENFVVCQFCSATVC